MKLNLHHGNDYLNGYLNIEMREVQKTDQRAEDHYMINGVVNNDFIEEVICHPGALEMSAIDPSEVVGSWHKFAKNEAVLKLKVIDIQSLCSAVSHETEGIKTINDHLAGYKRFFGVDEISSIIKSAGFKKTKTWYGPRQWLLNIEAIKQ